MEGMYYVYVLLCNDDEMYTGCTSDLVERLDRHNHGRVPATIKRLPVVLISYTAFRNQYTAFEFEKYLKTGSGRSFLKRHLLVKKKHP